MEGLNFATSKSTSTAVYDDYTAIKDQCDKKSFDESALDLRTKAIKSGKAGGSKRFKRRTNKVATEDDDEKDNQ